MMLRYFLLSLVVAASSAWDVDDRCLRRRELESWDEDEPFDEPEFEVDENFEEEEIRHLTDRELASTLRFNMKIHWQEGYCWQEEWKERKWCMECDGDTCGEGDKLELQVCENVARQEFNWVPTSGGGRLKVSNKNLCFERVGTNEYRLKICSSSSKQVLVGFNANKPFELYPRGLEGEKCLSNNRHHPKASEEIFTDRCSNARAAHTNRWEVYWPSSGGSSSGSGGSSGGSSSSKSLVTPVRSCSSSNPCGECEGDCDTDSHCKGNLVCFQKGANTPVPGCRGTDNSKTDFCVDPQNL
ncbi:Ricin-type beta-trefoil lectin domain [Fragilaria crotonensis]|nr:Ricin-type beta-trefoil lectin domain [Fragilaria crotonensis]